MLIRPLHIPYKFRRKFCRLCLATACLALLPSAADAQTCRMRVSVNAEGGRVEYREVYEYDYVWEKPSFPGGDGKLLRFINQNRRYPEAAYNAGIQGRVVCSFIVNSNGSISDVQVFKGVEASLNDEAVRIFRMMPSWNPGRINGMPVPVRVIRAVPFRR